MKILVISDTHGDIKRAINLVNSIKGIDLIITAETIRVMRKN